MMLRRIAGLVLAGGTGRRWGGPKAWAPLPGGDTFMVRCVAALRDGGVDQVMVTLPPGADGPRPRQATVVPLPAPDLDMFASLRYGLERLLVDTRWDGVVVVPVDHPLVAPETIARLADCRSAAAAPRYRGKKGHPIWLRQDTAVGIADGSLPGPTLREVLAAVELEIVDVDDPGVTANCNTSNALNAALELLAGRGRGNGSS